MELWIDLCTQTYPRYEPWIAAGLYLWVTSKFMQKRTPTLNNGSDNLIGLMFVSLTLIGSSGFYAHNPADWLVVCVLGSDWLVMFMFLACAPSHSPYPRLVPGRGPGIRDWWKRAAPAWLPVQSRARRPQGRPPEGVWIACRAPPGTTPSEVRHVLTKFHLHCSRA